MYKSLLLITSLFWIGCYSQTITVNTNTYSVNQLVEDVLVNKTCVPVTNINSITGTNFGSSNGIGYFENTNPAFPLSRGVILSTGDVANAPGPNTTQLNDGNSAWSGDTDLEATLLAAGIKMNSTNATVLEFDFVPFSPNFDFKFLFASEEYGNFQCQFSDAFAFLLTNKTTGVTTNLAVVPSTTISVLGVVPSTTIPISVVTIRNSLYNSSCSDENKAYFGVFNGGFNAASSATNFNGQTVVMNAASSTLTPNTTYHIKLVIADRQDNQADSAIFLGANSFNVGQDVLGPDLTVASNTAICDNSIYTIKSDLDPAIYSFKWKINGLPTGGNLPDLTVSKPGVYSLTYTIISTDCEVTTDEINIEYYNPIITPNPLDLYQCDYGTGQASFTYDLTFNTPIVQVPGTEVSYYASQADGTPNSNPILTPSIYNVATVSLPAKIWASILNTATNCAIVKSFQLEIIPPPFVNNPLSSDLTSCETSIGTANFNISSQTPIVLGAQSPIIYSVSYYNSIADANAGTLPIDTSKDYTSGNATIFVRIQNSTDSSCYSTTCFKIIAKPRPVLDPIPNQFVCSGYTLPVLVNPGNYYSGPNKTGTMLHAGEIITTDQRIYIYQETVGTPSCPSERSFYVDFVVLTDISPNNKTACDQYTLPTLGYGAHYFTLPGGSAGGGTELLAGASITTPGLNTIYTYFVSTDITNPCEIPGQFNVTINVTPTIAPIPNAFACVSFDLPPLTVGDYYTRDTSGNYFPANLTITTTTTLYVFATNNSCRTLDTIFTVYIGPFGFENITQCDPYNLLPAPIGEYHNAPNGGGDIIPPGLIEKTTTVYIYVSGAGTPNCTDNDSFTITIEAPYLPTPTNVTECESFLLPAQMDGGIYYSGPNKGLPILNVGDIISKTTTVYIYKPSATVLGCYNEKKWLITINQKPIIDSRGNVEQCNSYVLSPLTNGNYFEEPNGVNLIPAGNVISTNKRIYIFAAHPSDPTCFTENYFDISINGVEADPIPTQLSYCDSFTFPNLPTPNNFYYDAPGGPLGGGNTILPGTTVTAATVLPKYYIYYETGDRLNCSDENPFIITIAPRPVANPVSSLVECDTFGENDGVFQFDLTSIAIRNNVLNGQTPDANFTLTFFTSLADANNNAFPIPNPSTYVNDNAFTDNVWIRVTNNSITTPCFDVVELKLIVNPLPIAQLKPEYFICEDYETGTLLNPATLNTGLTASNYTFEWTLDGNPYGGNTSSITTSQIGDYVAKITDTNTNCVSTAVAKVTKYAPYLEITYSDAFENSSYISITVLGAGSGNYEYQIDDSLFQDSSVFNTISPGEHTISVRDKNGHCNPATINAVIIIYPKYFTPNGDGHHETWNITHLIYSNPEVPICIYDRYGKLIKEITPSTEGWNGMYNGEPLPSSDYWFTVNYSEKGTAKIFKAHFTLKR